MGVNEDKFDMPKSRFEEQRELIDEEMQAYKDMLRKKEKREVLNVFNVNPPKGIETPLKGDATVFHQRTQNNSVGIEENDMGVKATESGFNQTVRKDQATLIAELISRVTSLEEDMEFVLKHIRILELDRQIEVISPSWELEE